MDIKEKNILTKSANNIRALIAGMVEKAKSGHPGGAMGGANFINVLYAKHLNFDPDNLAWEHRDRFFLDPGHMSPMLYSQLALLKAFSLDDLAQFRQWGSLTPGHPEKDFSRGIENTSGPLGQGHTFAVGAAIAQKFMVERFGADILNYKIYTFISDGGVQEEISQGAGRIAGHLGLNNLIMFYDSNDIQLSSTTSTVTSEDTASKYRAWGWSVLEVDGTDPEALSLALDKAKNESSKPSLIIGKTIMGQGALSADGARFEKRTSTHGQPLGKAGASFAKTLQNLGADPENPFQIYAEVEEYYKSVLQQKKKYVQQMREKEQNWRAKNKDLAKKLDSFYRKDLAKLDFSSIKITDDAASRNSSGEVLSYLADNLENIIVASADLSDSDKTDSFLKKTKAFTKNDFSGSFLQAGVSELTMAAICNGMALHGGVIPACGTFFVFSDYMKPAVRTAALMELQVIYIWTHDAFRVGEDGPTHQPVEQEAQIRLMEHLQNHSGKNSMLVLRPADNYETCISWEMALENKNAPTALILSRQNIKTLPSSGEKYKATLAMKNGAYLVRAAVKPDLIMLASGSEVATLVAAADILAQDKIQVQIVSVPSEGLLRLQNNKYKESLMPSGAKLLGLTAGLAVTLEGLVANRGKVIGLNSFGYSAPADVLDEKLGYTAEHVASEARALLRDN